MIDPELCFEAIRGTPKRCGHHSRISNDDVKGLSRRQQGFGAGAHAFEIVKIQRNKFKASILGRGVLSNLGGGAFGLCQIAHGAHYLDAVRWEGSCSLYADPCLNASNLDPVDS